jgi:hypothetical protein
MIDIKWIVKKKEKTHRAGSIVLLNVNYNRTQIPGSKQSNPQRVLSS